MRTSFYKIVSLILICLTALATEKTTSKFIKRQWKFDPNRGPLDATAQEMSYDRKTGVVEAKGNAVLTRPDEEVRADYIRFNLLTGEAYATGNVVVVQGTDIIHGKTITGNVRSPEWTIEEGSGVVQPFRVINVSRFQQVATNLFRAKNITLTTCTNEYPYCHYHVYAREIQLVPYDHIDCWGTTWYFAGIPVIYLPYWYRWLYEDFGISIRPGSSSRMGTFLLSTVKYRVSPILKAETSLDFRSRRGVAFGQELSWEGDAELGYTGDIYGYFLNDKNPRDKHDTGDDINSQRYRLRFNHNCTVMPNNSLLLHFDYFSDIDMMEDFFENEYKKQYQPENYTVYTHRGPGYIAHIELRKRLNDFYRSINRLPEGSVNFIRNPIGNTGLYHEGRASAGLLQKVWEVGSPYEDQSVFRFDTVHTLLYPSKVLNFLTFIPRASIRDTYYSHTRYSVSSQLVETTSETIKTNTVVKNFSTDGDNRLMFELGVEAAFKAFRTWNMDSYPTRHVMEPYLNYTFVPEPSLTPSNIWHFDSVDTLDEIHQVNVGIRNKLQFKKENAPFDFIKADLYTIYNFLHLKGHDALTNLYWNIEVSVPHFLNFEIDGIYNLELSELSCFNTRLSIAEINSYTLSMEHRFTHGKSSLLSLYSEYSLNPDWTFDVYGRYEFEENRAEEYGVHIQRNFDCMSIRLGGIILPGYTRTDGTEQKDEWRITFEWWLTAFPSFRLSSKHTE